MGDVDAPVTQKSYVWNANNPVSNSDPDGHLWGENGGASLYNKVLQNAQNHVDLLDGIGDSGFVSATEADMHILKTIADLCVGPRHLQCLPIDQRDTSDWLPEDVQGVIIATRYISALDTADQFVVTSAFTGGLFTAYRGVGALPARVFWSGDGKAAAAFARSIGGQTLEQTLRGRALVALSKVPGVTADLMKPLWKKASLDFAQSARDTAYFVGTRSGYFFRTVEAPDLYTNPLVRDFVWVH